MSTRPSHPRQSSLDQQTSQQLEDKLAHRPEKATLIERNILKDDNGLAPSLVAAREKLQRSQLEDHLTNALAKRPPREELEKNGILKGAYLSTVSFYTSSNVYQGSEEEEAPASA